jgi:hypothetical protein
VKPVCAVLLRRFLSYEASFSDLHEDRTWYHQKQGQAVNFTSGRDGAVWKQQLSE